jgi:hypothetical protein
MFVRIRGLEDRLDEARRGRDAALLELRKLRAKTTNGNQAIANAFVQDLRASAKQRRTQVRDRVSLESYLKWMESYIELRKRELSQYLDGEILKLALAEIRVIECNSVACALNQELSRVRVEYAGHFACA